MRAKPIYVGAPARPPARGQNRLDFRDLLGGDGARGRVADGIAGIAGGGVAPGEGNAHCGPGVFCDLAVLAAVSDGPVHAFSRDSAEKRDHAGGSPTDEWPGLAARRAVAGDPAPALTAAAAGQLRGLRKSGSIPRECAVAIDKTPVRRWDRRPGDALIRGRTEKGKQAFEAYMTAQVAERQDQGAGPQRGGQDAVPCPVAGGAQLVGHGVRGRPAGNPRGAGYAGRVPARPGHGDDLLGARVAARAGAAPAGGALGIWEDWVSAVLHN